MLRQSLRDPAFVQDPYPVYARARAAGPVVWWEDYGMLAAFDHATVNAALRDRRLGREPLEPPQVPDHLAPFAALDRHAMLELEPPRHTRLRSLVARAFTTRRIAGLGPDIAAIAADCLSRVPRDAPFDLIPAFCQPIPVRVIARLLGVPEALAPDLLRWSTAMVAIYQAGRTPAVEKPAGQAAAEFTDFLRGHVEARRSTPADDLISHLIAAEEDGDRLSPDELIANCILLLNAGHEATVHSLGNAVKLLLETGTDIAAMSHAGVAAAVEEILRFDPPLHVFTRTAYQEVTLGGQTLQRGDQIALVLGAAGRDPAICPDPDRFDPTRDTASHLAFGAGIHFCVGAPLARLELQAALPVLFKTLPALRLTDAPRYADSYHFHKLDRLMVTAG